MAEEGLRRSGRVRKPVKSYADEQGDKAKIATKQTQAATHKRKINALDESENHTTGKPTIITLDDSTDDKDNGAPIAKRGKKSSKKAVKKASSAKTKTKASERPETEPEPRAETASQTKKASKARRTLTDRSWHDEAAQRRIAVTNAKVKRLAPGQKEYRLRDYVDEPPKSYHDFLKRARTERMYVLERERGVEEDCHANYSDCPCEKVQIAGSTGNVYTVTISHLPSCTCPVGIFTRKGQEKLCKHALYVLHHVLKAPQSLQQQNAYLTSELREIFSKAPALPSDIAEDGENDGNRKPVEDDCPICCMEFEKGDELVWCQTSCGNNLHKACFHQWARTKAHVTCPFCRADWQDAVPKTNTVTKVNMPTFAGSSGYRNVRDQLDYGE